MKLKRILLWATALLLLAVASIAITSPYGRKPGYPYRLVLYSVDIDAPVDAVFQYLGNSGNARRWSVYVHHITTLNSAQVADGQPGSVRRCYHQADEQGIRWDERIDAVAPGRMRRLLMFNLQEFPIQAEGLATEQHYEALPGGRCRLCFTVFFREGAHPTALEQAKTYIAAYRIKSIFRRNMDNIRREVEQRQRVAKS